MVLARTYTKAILPSKLRDELDALIPGVVESIVVVDDVNVTMTFTIDTDGTQQSIIDAAVAAHDNYCPKVKILQYIKDSYYYDYAPPKEHDYIRGLQIKLYPDRIFDQGLLTNVNWYSDSANTDLVLKVDIVYTIDSLDFITDRVTTRTWINEDDTEHEDTKVTYKIYTERESIDIGVRRRCNIVSEFQKPVINLMVQFSGYTPQNAVLEGSRFMQSLSTEIQSYINTPKLNQFEDALTAATEVWLDDDIGGGVTIRDYLMAEITIQ